MLDIKFIRNHSDIVKEAIRKRGANVDIDALLKCDDDRRALLVRVEEMRSQQNVLAREVANADATTQTAKIEESRQLKQLLQSQEEQLKTITETWNDLLLSVPNVPDISVPEGKDETENVQKKTWGEPTVFNFPSKDHIELMLDLDLVDFERGTKTHGFRGYFLKNDGARLSWAIWNYALDFYMQRGFQFFLPPAIIRKQHLYGTGHLPGDEHDIYTTQDNDCLVGTAEAPMMAYHSDEVIEDALPKRYLAFSPCYRREAGSHGKETRGLVRVHEFFKIEQLILCEASHQQSNDLFEEVNKNFEEFLESLEIPYRQLLICTGDLSSNKVKQYDTEAWMPSENAYRELSSASYYHDYQTRRFNTRYRDASGQILFVHSLNATAIATPRSLAVMIENWQQQDGSIRIPAVLQPYLGKSAITKNNTQHVPLSARATATKEAPITNEAPQPEEPTPPARFARKSDSPNVIPLDDLPPPRTQSTRPSYIENSVATPPVIPSPSDRDSL